MKNFLTALSSVGYVLLLVGQVVEKVPGVPAFVGPLVTGIAGVALHFAVAPGPTVKR